MLKGIDDAVDPSPENSFGNVDTSPRFCSLYFKGLVNKNSLAGFGVAVLGPTEDLLFQMKGPIHHDSTITALEADVTALKRGLSEAENLGIKHIAIFCDHYPTFELVTGRSVSEENMIALLMVDIRSIRERFASSLPIFVDQNSFKYAYELARETISSEVRILMNPPKRETRSSEVRILMNPPKRETRSSEVRILMNPPKRERISSEVRILMNPLERERISYQVMRILMNPFNKAKATRKETCNICMDDNIDANQMSMVDKCHHRYCSECMKQYIETRLLERSVMRCPHYHCKSQLILRNYVNLLTPKLRRMWQERIKEDLIPVTERIYCPNQRCSALMSKTELTKETDKGRVKRSCFKCNKLFCINCKVLWHNNMSCDDYKKLHPCPTKNDVKIKALANQQMWRQCVKCQHMIELSAGCVKVKCRCGHKFCYRCGADAGSCNHGHGRPPQPPSQPSQQPNPQLMWFASSCWVFFAIIFIIVYKIYH